MTTASGSRLEQLERRLAEAYDDLWNSFVDPREALFDSDGSSWLPISSYLDQRNSTGPAFTTEAEHREIRAQCRALAVSNEYAINGHENRISYIVGRGHVYRASPKKGSVVDPVLAGLVQGVIDEFIVANEWKRRQQELVLRCDRDGEAFLRFFVDADGSTSVRFVEPVQVSTPPEFSANPADSFGIRVDPDDVESVQGYFIDGQLIDAAEIQHRKANVDLNVKRGLPLFYPVRKNLRRAEKLLRNMSVVSEIQSAIALIRHHRNGARTALQQFISQQADTTVSSATSGRSTPVKRYAPGTILDAHADVDYEFPAAGLDAGNFVRVLQAELRAIASRLVMPEFMLSSDASNGNYASTMIAETPAVRMFERLQAQTVAEDLAVMYRVVSNACLAGRLRNEAATNVTIQAEPPTLAMRNRLEEAEVFRIQYQSGILSPQTWSALAGLDYDQEQLNFAEARAAENK
ncbi:MAG TPA: phage portal protein [Pirellulales bacterium]|jgi:capsid protein|nr:phage portal protein [Pirellulales bacterium]